MRRLPAEGGERPTPSLPATSVCEECKRAGHVCVLVAAGTPCLGPITRSARGALCPACRRGCFGLKETPNPPALSARFAELGMPGTQRVRFYRTFDAVAEASRRTADALAEVRVVTGACLGVGNRPPRGVVPR